MSRASTVSAEEFGRLVATKRDSGAHPSEAYRSVARETRETQMDTDETEYPFANINYLTGGKANVGLELSSSSSSSTGASQNLLTFATRGGAVDGRVEADGLLWQLSPASAEKRAAVTGPRATIQLTLSSAATKRRTVIGAVDLKELWDSSSAGKTKTHSGSAAITLKMPALSAYQLSVASRNGLPSLYVHVRGTLKWRPSSQSPELLVESVAVSLKWIASPEMATDPIDTDVHHYSGRSIKAPAGSMSSSSSSSGADPMKVNANRTNGGIKEFDQAALRRLMSKLSAGGVQLKSLGIGRVGVAPIVIHSTADDNGKRADKPRHLGNVSQLLTAAAIIHHVSIAKNITYNSGLMEALEDNATLAEMLSAADSGAILDTLDKMYGGRQNIPSLASLLGHTSGLPHTLTETPQIVEAIFDTKEPVRGDYLYDDSVTVFARLLGETTLQSLPAHKAFLESPLGFAILKFALPNHDLKSVLDRFIQGALRIEPAEYVLGKKSLRKTKSSPIYLAYDGLSITTDAMLAFVQHPNWYGVGEAMSASFRSAEEFADSMSWLSLLHRTITRFSGHKNAAFGMGQMLVKLSKGKKNKSRRAAYDSGDESGDSDDTDDESRSRRKAKHVPALKLISADRNITVIIMPQIRASAVVFYRKEGGNRSYEAPASAPFSSSSSFQAPRAAPHELCAVVTRTVCHFLLKTDGAKDMLKRVSEGNRERLPPLAQTPTAQAEAMLIRELRQRPQPSDLLRQALPVSAEPWPAVFQDPSRKNTISMGIEPAHSDGSLVLAMHKGAHTMRFEIIWDETDSLWYVIDPITHLRGGLLEIHRLRPRHDDFEEAETVVMVGFRGRLFASAGVVEKINAMIDGEGSAARRYQEVEKQTRTRAREARRIQKRAARAARALQRTDDESSGDEQTDSDTSASAASSGDESDTSASSSSDASDTESASGVKNIECRGMPRRRRRPHQNSFKLLQALEKGFTRSAMNIRFQGPTETNVGEWVVSFQRSQTLASILAFPSEKLIYPTSVYMGLLGKKHTGLVPYNKDESVPM